MQMSTRFLEEFDSNFSKKDFNHLNNSIHQLLEKINEELNIIDHEYSIFSTRAGLGNMSYAIVIYWI